MPSTGGSRPSSVQLPLVHELQCDGGHHRLGDAQRLELGIRVEHLGVPVLDEDRFSVGRLPDLDHGRGGDAVSS